jgi:hypothetical protein
MSVHGNQNLLPLFLRKETNKPDIKENAELALAYYLLTNELKEGEKILSFSRLLWPLLLIQGIISTHIVLDGLMLLSKKGKLTNPPRQPQIGHILRNVDNRSEMEQLNKIIDVLTYKDAEAQEIGEGEESEYRNLRVSALINPDFFQALMKLLPFLENQPILDYMVLDTPLSTEGALDISEQYRKVIDEMKGNGLRWETVDELIKREVDKWITELVVQLKDIDSRYSSQLNKTSSTIDSTQIKEEMDKLMDNIDLWKASEKKKVIENISALFKTIERSLEDIVKKNRFFSRDDALVGKKLEDLFPNFENHIEYLRDAGKKYLELIETQNQQYVEFKAGSTQIDIEAEEKLESRAVDLNVKLQDRDKQMTEIDKEKQQIIAELEEKKEKYEVLIKEIKQILQTKKGNCLKEANDLTGWSLKDDESELFSKPIQWIYMPLYAMFIEDEDMMDERMVVVFPSYIGQGGLYENISDSFNNLKQFLNEKIEDDMKVRSNFEFSCENKNLLEDPNFKKQMMKGISQLRDENLLTEEMDKSLREQLDKLS